MRRYYYEDGRWPWRADGILRRFLQADWPASPEIRREPGWPGQRKSKLEKRKSAGRALDVGMGYGRNALWLAERGYEVEGWEKDRAYVAEARREARRRGVRLTCVEKDFTRLPRRGRPPRRYDVVVISLALHQVRRSAALRVLRWTRRALAPGGQLFLMVKLTGDRYFQRVQATRGWKKVTGEKNTLLRPQTPGRGYFHAGRPRRRRLFLSALTPGEVQQALRGPRGKARGRLRIRHWREVVLRSDWEEAEPVTHHMAEVVAQKKRIEIRNSKSETRKAGGGR